MTNTPNSGSKVKPLVVDIKGAQQTEVIKSLIAKTRTVLGNIEEALITSFLLVVDIVDNKTLRNFETGANNFSQHILVLS